MALGQGLPSCPKTLPSYRMKFCKNWALKDNPLAQFFCIAYFQSGCTFQTLRNTTLDFSARDSHKIFSFFLINSLINCAVPCFARQLFNQLLVSLVLLSNIWFCFYIVGNML
ncbi:uncharacterized protein ASCRUDRAFT_109540 [Ascoidea rubescens DSM 1968]|uniref:Uncharacterized protein n=1 Tax=Ascoidea rubescens DSM 1968 TaxID=1344418 RepID=A0A1D2VD41_9ASCO|nr:hypothetical protein ASCRUDRAFT_109540 [Ascoidea rubescens DSM 1968]ODV59551.1 hypothetical protein ASCRUDRAFT_109540 [Ascoidea rubescens DSM 1968]